MKPKRKLLFFGELPPYSVHGIAISNKINLSILESVFEIFIVKEYGNIEEHNKLSFKKFLKVIMSNLHIIGKSVSNKFDYFYLTFSLSTTGSLKTLFAILSFRMFNRGKIVLHIHRGDFFTSFNLRKINSIVANIVFRLVDKTILLSTTQKTDFELNFESSFHILYNTIESEYSFSRSPIGSERFIFISNYILDKGIVDLLEVFADLSEEYSNIRLKTFGAFTDIDLKDRIIDYNSISISVNERIDGMAKFSEISDSDCLILPSKNEGQPIILLEAMSVGTPVIATNVGFVNEIVGDDYPFLVNPDSKEALKEVIIKFMNYNDISNLSHDLKTRYYELFSPEAHAKALMEIFV